MTEEQIKQKAEKSRLSTKNGHDLSYDPKYREVYDKAYIAGATVATKELKAQIEKMKCCDNCKFGQNRCYLKDGTGKACGEWEIKENDIDYKRKDLRSR